MISVIIPVYNVEDCIDRCLESVINQTYKNFEVIMIDDGSIDKSYDILMKWVKMYPKKIKVIKQKNKGAGPARNKGLSIAKGEYLTFIDSDDYIDLDFLEVMINNIKDNDVVVTGFRYIFNGKLLYRRSLKNTNWAKFQQLVIWGKLYRTKFIVENNILFEDLKTAQDIAFTFNFYSKNPKIIILNYVGYNYIYNYNSISYNKKIQVDNNVIKLYDYIFSCINNTAFFEENVNEIVFYFYKEILARLSKKAEFVSKNELFDLELVYYKWLLTFLSVNSLKFKFKIQVGESCFINLVVFMYVFFRKIHLQKLFLSLLYLKKHK